MNKKEMGKTLFLMTVSFLIGGIGMLFLLQSPLLEKVIRTKNNVIMKNGTQIYEKTSLSASVEKIYDAVVVVQGYEQDELNGSGTGFVYKVDEKYGYILTNEHVISDSSEVKVVMTTDEEIPSEVLGKDKFLDLAVLRIPKQYITLVAAIGSSEKMNLGDTIFTVGSPLGYDYRGSVTSGVLSGKDRMVATSLTDRKDADWVVRVLQIDASINPGNSGGPLLNINGEVIGICSLKLVKDNIEGMGFAIPIEYAMSHVSTLEAGKTIRWPVLGISMINVTDKVSLMNYHFSIPKTVKEGVVILSVKESTSASSAHLKKGDIITKLNKTKIKDIAYLRYELYQYQSGDTITITYIRDEKEYTTKVTLTSN